MNGLNRLNIYEKLSGFVDHSVVYDTHTRCIDSSITRYVYSINVTIAIAGSEFLCTKTARFCRPL